MTESSSEMAILGDMQHTFTAALGRKALVITSSFPFTVIGTVHSVGGGFLSLAVQVCNTIELEGTIIRIALDAIEVFYIERPGFPIPAIT